MAHLQDSVERLRHLMMTRFRARHFSLLITIAETGSIHRAAAAHGLSQPGVSRLLKEIESILELPLFERTSSGTVPTIYGLRTAKTFRAIITEIEYLAQELDILRSGGGGIIRVGVINFISRSMISEAILNLRRDGHRFLVHLEHGNTETLLSALHALQLDCVVARKVSSKSMPEVDFQPIYQQEPCIVFRAGLLEPDEKATPDLLARLSWILPTRGTPGRVEFDRTLARSGIPEPTAIVETSDLNLIHDLVRKADGVCAILPSDIGFELAERGEIETRPLGDAYDYPEVGLVELPRVARDPNVELFRQSFAAVAQARTLDQEPP